MGTSPIAADGGFGPMDYEDEEEDNNDDNEVGREFDGEMEVLNPDADHHASSPEVNEESIGDEFDDFEEGAAADDFGDFDNGSQPLRNVEDVESASSKQTSYVPLNPFVSNITSKYKIVLIHCPSYTGVYQLRADLYCALSPLLTFPPSLPSKT